MNVATGLSPTLSPELPPDGKALLEQYHPVPGVFDTMMGQDGQLRAGWRGLADGVRELTSDGVRSRCALTVSLLDEDGIYFPGYQDATANPRPWQLDSIPFQMADSEWKQVSAALRQRTLLLERILDDLLGEQRLFRERVMPPGVLFENPHYHRAYCDLPVARGRRLTLCAADVTRDANGRWHVLSDRTQAPSGLGFVLENRIAISQVHPSLFRGLRVRRVAPFMNSLRAALTQLSPRTRVNPRIVLFSEGLLGKRGIEDAYLSRYLGFSLVEGPDLAVRQGTAVLKTLGGPLPVDVVFRRVSDEQCDPVELSPTTPHGVAGLLESMRGKRVAVGNALGCQLVEAPALQSYASAACRFLLGEEPLIESVPSRWCGDSTHWTEVQSRLNEVEFVPAFRVSSSPVDLTQLSQKRRQLFVDSLLAHPEQWVARDRLPRSTTPALDGTQLTPHYWSLRSFVVPVRSGYEALPGGLVRVAEQPHTLGGTGQDPIRVQDCWVSSTGPVSDAALLPPQEQPVTLRRGGIELPSRVADDLFWLGRCMEDAESVARVTRTILQVAGGESQGTVSPEFQVLTEFLEAHHHLLADGTFTDHSRSVEEWIAHALHTDLRPTSLQGLLRESIRRAQRVRDRISVDAWRVVTRIERELAQVAEGPQSADSTFAMSLLNRVILDLVTFGGMMSESMTRSLGWRFLDLGRRLRRTHNTAGLLRATLVAPATDEHSTLEAVLTTCDSLMTYRSRYLASLQPLPTLDLLITDETNPRSVLFQVRAIEAHVRALPRKQDSPTRDLDQRIALQLLHDLELSDPAELAVMNAEGVRDSLEHLLANTLNQLPNLDQAISGKFLIHAGLPRQFLATLGA